MAEAALERLKALYTKPLYVRLFTAIRLGHAGYDAIEPLLPRRGRLLDLGCGYGLFANYLALASPEREVRGVELDAHKLRHADKGVPGVTFAREDVLEVKEPRLYDGIVLLHVLHHLPGYKEQETLLRRCAEWLAPGGTLAILEVERRPFWKHCLAWLVDHALYPGDGIYFRDRPDMLALLASLGFKTEATSLQKGRPFPHVLYVCRKS